MTETMSELSSRDVSLSVLDDEAVVVAPVAFWERLVEWFHQSAEEFPEQSENWELAASHVVSWLSKTRVDG